MRSLPATFAIALGLLVGACVDSPTSISGDPWTFDEPGRADTGPDVECRATEDGDCTTDNKYGSCAEIHAARPEATDGTYTIHPGGPDGEYNAFEVECDMTSRGGGWTRLTPCLVRNQLNGTLVAEDRASEAAFDDQCRPYTIDRGSHTYHYTFQFPAGFQEFMLRNYEVKNSTDTDNCLGDFKQIQWTRAHGPDACSDISFGTAEQSGPTTSFSRHSTGRGCPMCVTDWPANETIYRVDAAVTTFRIGWGEFSGDNPDNEGWFPWWSGTIWVR